MTRPTVLVVDDHPAALIVLGLAWLVTEYLVAASGLVRAEVIL